MNAITWLSQHIPQLGWVLTTVGLVALIYKVIKFFVRFETKLSASFQHIEKMATNEFPHIQHALEDVSGSMKDIRDDLRELMLHNHNK
jgi:hypothetical protein